MNTVSSQGLEHGLIKDTPERPRYFNCCYMLRTKSLMKNHLKYVAECNSDSSWYIIYWLHSFILILFHFSLQQQSIRVCVCVCDAWVSQYNPDIHDRHTLCVHFNFLFFINIETCCQYICVYGKIFLFYHRKHVQKFLILD